ncbi:hypothetical protein QVG61_07680 [Thiohalobacter sp. IOR34]|uniref:hypothetical protein n=1 Tax=Thiohalobacter sp. IOR34 TaxID=3057176 RepID=UPI0025B1063B|nr:hypothetical protein [Thiohalobacter sp. IOR34]WJW74397.1 hypothetical protein QVG61_07680 [Thiohalobacter sp. IOR34]
MLSVSKKICLAGALFTATAGASFAADILKPFNLAYTTTGDMAAVADEVKQKVLAAGFEIAGSYTPYDGAMVLAITNDELKKAAASSEDGGYVAGQRVTITKVGNEIQVSYTNPVYYGNAYRISDTANLEKAESKLEQALGKKESYGTGEKQLSAQDLRKYHYMFGMEYFDDPSELAEYDSYDEAIAAVEEGLAQGKGGAHKVYRIDIPGKEETVFGVALSDGCSGDQYIMSRVDRDKIRSTGHLPYEILVSGGDVYALYARFRIAVSWPHLPMIQSDTGATFFNIMCAPNAIEEALVQAAGGEI